jgi:hypothetical protein
MGDGDFSLTRRGAMQSSAAAAGITGTSLDAVNRVGRPPQVFVKQAAFDRSSKNLTVAPYSIELYEFIAA